MFTSNDLVKDLDRMKAHWEVWMKNPGPAYGSWYILDNLSRVDNFKIDRKTGTVYVDRSSWRRSSRIRVVFHIQTFVLGHYKYIAKDVIQAYKAKKPMRPLRGSAFICSRFQSGDATYADRRFLSLDYEFAEGTSLEDMTQAMKGVIESDLDAIEYNTLLLLEEVREWLDLNLRDIMNMIEAEKLVVYEDPLDVLATNLSKELGLLRVREWDRD